MNGTLVQGKTYFDASSITTIAEDWDGDEVMVLYGENFFGGAAWVKREVLANLIFAEWPK